MDLTLDETGGDRRKNRAVADLLEEIGDLLEIKGEQHFRVNAYRKAARQIEALQEPIEQIFRERRLRKIPGVGEALEKKITEFLATGQLQYIERLRAQVPPSLVTLLDVPGLGPRKAREIYDQLGVTNLDELQQAAESHRLQHMTGVGEKTEQNILRELGRLRERSKRHVLSAGLERAETLLSELRRHPAVERAEYAGSARRRQETVGDLDILVVTSDSAAVHAYFKALPQVIDVVASGEAKTTVLVSGGIQVDLRVVPAESWGAALQYFTGSKEHNVQLREMAVRRGLKLNEYGLFRTATSERLAGDDEAGIYAALDLDCPPPELREGLGEVEAARTHTLPDLITAEQLQGDAHVHTNWTDGASSLEEMALAAIKLGRAYLVVTDHSRALRVARGLEIEQLREQRALAEKLNADLAPFRIFLGTEMDILTDGELDYPDEVLAQLDYVSVSIHSAMKQPEPVMTARILRALENPWVVTFNHPHGRLLGHRDSYEVNMDAVIDAAARQGVALEINSQPHRLDLDGGWVKRVIDRGGKVMISSDAHTTAQLDLLPYGVAMARRGWTEASSVLNSLTLDAFQDFLERHRRIAAAR